MVDQLTEMAARQGDKMAVIDDRPDGRVTKWTYAELEDKSNKLARVLQNKGLSRGQKVVWCGPNSPWIVALMQASRKIGSIAVPLNYRLTPEEAAYVVDNSDAEVVFADAEYAELFETIAKDTRKVREVLTYDGAPGKGMHDVEALIGEVSGEAVEPDGELEPGDGSSMIYTSGTTGKPKGVVRKNTVNPEQGLLLIERVGYRPGQVFVTTGPLYHSGPAGFMAFHLMLGNPVVIQRRFDPEDWLRLIDTYRVSATFSAPTPIRRVCQVDDAVFAKYDVSSMKAMVANAAPWSMALKKMYLERFPEDSLYEVYGSTELGVNTVLLPEHQLSKPGSCGQPSPLVEIILFDDDGNEITEPHTPGELFVRSPSIFTTYHKAHDKYMEDRRGDVQTVGDVAYFDEDGFYYICDRKKDMIISGGVNIYPAEVESALEHHPDIMDVAVFGIPDEEWGESVHAVVVRRVGSEIDAAIVKEFAREHLANYKIPRSVEFVDEIPRTGSGKILKRVLREPYWAEHRSKVL